MCIHSAIRLADLRGQMGHTTLKRSTKFVVFQKETYFRTSCMANSSCCAYAKQLSASGVSPLSPGSWTPVGALPQTPVISSCSSLHVRPKKVVLNLSMSPHTNPRLKGLPLANLSLSPYAHVLCFRLALHIS